MSLATKFDWVADQRPLNLPLGKTILLLVFMGIPGKLIVRLVNRIIRNVLSPTAPDYLKKVDLWTRIAGFLAGAGATWGFENWNWLRNKLGSTGVEALSVGTLAGTLDAMMQRSGMGYENRDFTNYVSEGLTDRLAAIVEKVRGTALVGPRLGGLPEAQSSAWETPRTEEFIQGPAEKPAELGTPEKPADPVQRAEEILAEKSKF